jgi:hypothetical protein
MTIRALVFDLAGVLLDFGGPESVYKMSDRRLGDKEFFRFWSEAKSAHDLHCGRCTPEAFARHAVRELGLPVTSERFLAEYQTWLRGPYPGALELLEQLRPQYRVACLSNTDELNVRKFAKSCICRSGSTSASTPTRSDRGNPTRRRTCTSARHSTSRQTKSRSSTTVCSAWTARSPSACTVST